MRAIAEDIKANILKEQFIPDNLFLYITKGKISFFDGNTSYTLKAGECCIARKNHLAKFIILDSAEGFEPILFCFDEAFLQEFKNKHNQAKPAALKSTDAFIKVPNSTLIDNFIYSLKPYYKGIMQLDEAFEDLKYEELLIILLKEQPALAGVFFDFAAPQKINIESFMNKNFKFNASIQRFAYLTGRSLSAFKRDFKQAFNETPSRWLMKKRLHEAHFLIQQGHKKPSEIYLELGFESLSHFSFAFKKHFGLTPTALADSRLQASR